MSRTPDYDWYLQDWMNLYGKVQFSLVTELGWQRATANKVWHGQQPYKRDMVNEVAAWLQVKPYELLMHPEDAMAIRRTREAAALVVANNRPDAPALSAVAKKRTG
jgi:hypothetical protein